MRRNNVSPITAQTQKERGILHSADSIQNDGLGFVATCGAPRKPFANHENY
jgi:hypothetical protein